MQETWELLADIEQMRDEDGWMRADSREIAQLLGIQPGRASALIHRLRDQRLIDSGEPLNSRRKVTRLRLTREGEHILKLYTTQGEDAAEAVMPPRKAALRPAAPAAPPQSLRPTQSAPERLLAVAKAREILGPDAPLDDVLKVAEFAIG